jgi:hypothetical protein
MAAGSHRRRREGLNSNHSEIEVNLGRVQAGACTLDAAVREVVRGEVKDCALTQRALLRAKQARTTVFAPN